MSSQNGTSIPAVRGCPGGAEELALSTTCANAGAQAKSASHATTAFTALEPEIRPERAAREPQYVEPAEQAVVGEAGAVIPQRPADVALRRSRRTRLSHELHGAPGARKGDDDDRGEGRELPERDQRKGDRVDQRDGRDVERARRALAQQHRKRADAFAAVEVHLVDVLAYEDRHHAQAVRDRGVERRGR